MGTSAARKVSDKTVNIGYTRPHLEIINTGRVMTPLPDNFPVPTVISAGLNDEQRIAVLKIAEAMKDTDTGELPRASEIIKNALSFFYAEWFNLEFPDSKPVGRPPSESD